MLAALLVLTFQLHAHAAPTSWQPIREGSHTFENCTCVGLRDCDPNRTFKVVYGPSEALGPGDYVAIETEFGVFKFTRAEFKQGQARLEPKSIYSAQYPYVAGGGKNFGRTVANDETANAKEKKAARDLGSFDIDLLAGGSYELSAGELERTYTWNFSNSFSKDQVGSSVRYDFQVRSGEIAGATITETWKGFDDVSSKKARGAFEAIDAIHRLHTYSTFPGSGSSQLNCGLATAPKT